MSLTKYKKFENLYYQNGNYIYVSDRSNWPVGIYATSADIVLCGVWYLTGDESSKRLHSLMIK